MMTITDYNSYLPMFNINIIIDCVLTKRLKGHFDGLIPFPEDHLNLLPARVRVIYLDDTREPAAAEPYAVIIPFIIIIYRKCRRRVSAGRIQILFNLCYNRRH